MVDEPAKITVLSKGGWPKASTVSERTSGSASFDYGDIVNIKCDCCGKMIPTKPLLKVVMREVHRFCGTDCYELYLDYKVKKRA